MSREAVVPTAPIDTTTQEHKSSPKAKHILTYPPQCAEERLNTDSESILHRRVMTREKDASGLARRYREDDELDRMSRRSPSRTRTETMIGVVEANDGAPSPSPQSLSGRDTFTSKPPSDSTVNDSGGGKNGDHVPPDGGLTQKTVSTRKRTLSQLSLEAPMSAKRPPPRSTVREQIWPFTPARSAESDVGVSINDAENGTDKGHADLIADGQPRRGRSGFRACQRCQQFGVKCDVDKPCRKCRFSGSGKSIQAPFYYSVKTLSVGVLTISPRLHLARARSHPKPTFSIHRGGTPIRSRRFPQIREAGTATRNFSPADR